VHHIRPSKEVISVRKNTQYNTPNNKKKVPCVPTKIEELTDQLKSVPVPSSLASYPPLNAEP
jgi:hypothetical protein